MKPSVAHTVLMQKAAEACETALYAAFPEETATVRRVTDCDFLITAPTPDGEKSVRVSIRKS